jgi:signal transduction histidine kinase
MKEEEKVKDRTLKLGEKSKKLEKALEKEKQLSELKSRFVSMASHEFRTPLSSILSSANLIGRYEESEQQDKRMKHVTRIISSVKNLTFILNDFLSLEKLESGKVNFHPVQIDFEEYVESLMDEIRLLAKGKQEIIFNYSGKKEVFIDHNLVKNVLINLLSNAVKYSPKGKEVELISKNENGFLEIFVKDYGIGIPKADQAEMFSRFFRATNVENIQGTGLGLTIVKRYLDLMGGEIDFESEQYKGSTFRVKIPQ